MKIWCQPHSRQTVFRHAIWALFTMLLLSVPFSILTSVGVNAQASGYTIGLQGRLLTKDGPPVVNGSYNMQFKIYKGGDGTKPDNPGGEVIWSESYLNNGSQTGVPVKDGRFAVQLGSAQPFSGSIDWSSGDLRLSMNIAGSSTCFNFDAADCKADGEMLPMKRISAAPFAMSAGKLGDKEAGDFVQLGQGKQTDASGGSSIFVDKTGNGHLIQLQNNGNDSFMVTNSGDIRLGSHGDRSITLESREDAGASLTLKAGSSSSENGGDLVLKGGGAGSDGSGGNIVLRGGENSEGDADGLVIIGTPTFATTVNDANCRPDGGLASGDCQISDKSINTSAAIVIGFNSADLKATLPDPAIKTPGRVMYIIGASDSQDFSLVYNQKGDSITMQPDTATSLLWNGTAWMPVGLQQNTTVTTPTGTDPLKEKAKKTDTDTGTSTKETPSSKPSNEPADTVEGSMYYDDTLGKIRCYQNGSWGDCTSAPDAFITISPEYSGAVMNGTDLGTISSDLCSDVLNIGDGSEGQELICGEDETYNYYRWNTAEETPQTRSIYLTYKLPANFKEFVPDSTSLTSRVDSDEASVSYQLYRSRKSENLVACGEATSLTEPPGSWHSLKAEEKADPAECEFEAGDSFLIRINLTAKAGASAYVSDIDFVYSSR